jgi:hypothetical protein
VLEPHLPPVAPPPNMPPNELLCELPQALVDAMRDPVVEQTVEEQIALGQVESEWVDLIREHKIVTGMTKRAVIGAFLSQPTRERWQGPPGGDTLLWQPGGIWVPARWFVRFDEWGHAVAAGRY